MGLYYYGFLVNEGIDLIFVIQTFDPSTLSVLFDYGDIVYESCSQNNLDRLQKMQNQAARIISGSSHYTHSNDMYAGLNWLSLKK